MIFTSIGVIALMAILFYSLLYLAVYLLFWAFAVLFGSISLVIHKIFSDKVMHG